MQTSGIKNIIWKRLTGLKDLIDKLDSVPGLISFCLVEEEPEIVLDTYQSSDKPHCLIIEENKSIPPGTQRVVFVMHDIQGPTVLEEDLGNDELVHFLKIYLGVVLAPLLAKRRKRAISFTHFAQSVDGRISTPTGKSRWISCQENLIHSHRMRALCDGILIGANTLQIDHPQLTVRHVKGKDPVKIIIGDTAVNFESVLKDYNRVILIGSSEEEKHPDIEYIRLKPNNGLVDPRQVLQQLYKRGIRTVYLEGGAFTSSHFLAASMIDFLQLYIAPRLFGSGISSFTLPGIDEVNESITFERYDFMLMGEGILFTAELPGPEQ